MLGTSQQLHEVDTIIVLILQMKHSQGTVGLGKNEDHSKWQGRARIIALVRNAVRVLSPLFVSPILP